MRTVKIECSVHFYRRPCITLFPFYFRTRETITPPPAKKQKSEAKDNRKNVTKTSVNASATRIAKKTSPRINKSSLKSDGKRKSFNASVRFEPLVQMQSVPNEENENYGIFDTNR